MICHNKGFSPISTIGLGMPSRSSLIVLREPPARITTFMLFSLQSFELPPFNSIYKLQYITKTDA